jgi:hypothetical protein
MNEEKRFENICRHEYTPLGFQKISSDERKVEVIACIACKNCGMFRTKILYFDRQHDLNKKEGQQLT